MAGYPRKILSLELALKEVVKKIKDSGLKQATGKSESHFRKCSDPNDNDHNIHHKDSIAIDIFCMKNGFGTPMLNVHEDIVESGIYSIKQEDFSITLINIGARIGRLMEVAEKSISDKSEGGKEISQTEIQNIYSKIVDVEEKIIQLKLFLDKKK